MTDTFLQLEIMEGEIRDRLRELRQEDPAHESLRKWVAFLAKRTGYRPAPNTVRRQEDGLTEMKLRYVLAVMVAAEVNPLWLFCGLGPREANPGVGEAVNSFLRTLRRQAGIAREVPVGRAEELRELIAEKLPAPVRRSA